MAFSPLPEEILLRILVLARANTNTLLVSRQFFRIAAPLLYRTLRIHTAHHAHRALHTLARRPALAADVRRIVFGAISLDGARLLALCDRLQDVDLCLSGGLGPAPADDLATTWVDADAEAFCRALEQRRTIVHLTLRKDPAVYLTHPRPVYVLERLAHAVRCWTHLETVHLAFRISCSPSAMPLARALSTAPRLRAVRALLPAVWNTFLLVVSANPRLEKVMLYAQPVHGPIQTWLGPATKGKAGRCDGDDDGDDGIEHAVLGTGLYMSEVKQHARLSELVKAGTSIIRTRAHTTIVTQSTAPRSGAGTLLGAVRAKEVAVELLASATSGSR